MHREYVRAYNLQTPMLSMDMIPVGDVDSVTANFTDAIQMERSVKDGTIR